MKHFYDPKGIALRTVYIKSGNRVFPTNYLMTSRGEIYKHDNKKLGGKKISVWVNGHHGKRKTGGYPYVSLYHKKKKYHLRLSVLVARHLVANPDPKRFKEVDHKDRDRTNYNPSNLRWATRTGNNNNRTN